MRYDVVVGCDVEWALDRGGVLEADVCYTTGSSFIRTPCCRGP